MSINKFHDILPNISIPEVYVDSNNEYGQIFSMLGSRNGPWHSAAQTLAMLGADQLRLVNFTGQSRSDFVQFDGELENDLFRISFDATGKITFIFDKKRQRETVAAGAKANRLIAYEDKPMEWDAWNIDHYSRNNSGR